MFSRSYATSVLKSLLAAPTRYMLRHLAFCARNPKLLFRALGMTGFTRFVFLPAYHELRRLLSNGALRSDYFLSSPDAAFPLRCRVGSSDIDVFRQIFVEREYACLDDLHEPRLMLDCGANVGFASAWFLSRYPTLHVIAVEPDPGNAAAARVNLASFGSRVTLCESGIWSSPARLTIVRDALDGREWAVTVRESRPHETYDLIAVDIPTLMKDAPANRIDVLKIDIEGAEGEVFGNADTGWVNSVENLVIEIHGPTLAKIVDAAIPQRQFQRSHSGELTCYRRTASSSMNLADGSFDTLNV